MKIGYCRVSTNEQNLNLQTNALEKAGVDRIFSDKISGTKTFRPGLSELLSFARENDCVVIWRLDRLARSLKDLIEISGQLQARNIQLISLTENIDTTTTTGKLFFHIFGALAEFERNLIIERTRAGLEAARARGRSGGRKPVLIGEKAAAAAKLLVDSKDYAAIARSLNVSARTIRRFALGEYPAGRLFDVRQSAPGPA
jgi:DNA invertase Pin-like site-specific DNA recombinase